MEGGILSWTLSYELMSAIRFWNTPKVDLSHYSYIFSNTDVFEAELNNVTRYRLWTILYLEIKKGEEAMNML